MGSIIVMTFNIRGYFPLLSILQTPMISTHILFQGVSSANLASNLLFLPFCTLAYIIVRNFLLEGFSNAQSVQMLANNCPRSIQFRIKQIRVVSSHYIFLEFLWNYYFTILRYKFYCVPVSAKITPFIFCAFNFFLLGRGLPADSGQ